MQISSSEAAANSTLDDISIALKQIGKELTAKEKENAQQVLIFLNKAGITPVGLGIDPIKFAHATVRQRAEILRFSPQIKIVPVVNFDGYEGAKFRNDFFKHSFNVYTSVAEIYVLKHVLDETSDFLGSTEATRDALAHLQASAAFINHDFSMHTVGILNTKSPGEFYKKKIMFQEAGIKVSNIEQVSAIFHRILLEKIFAINPRVKKIFLKNLQKCMEIVAPLPPQLRQKWYSLIKYLIWSVINPESEEGKALIKQGNIGSGYTGMNPDEWARIVHTRHFSFLDEDSVVQTISCEAFMTKTYLNPDIF